MAYYLEYEDYCPACGCTIKGVIPYLLSSYDWRLDWDDTFEDMVSGKLDRDFPDWRCQDPNYANAPFAFCFQIRPGIRGDWTEIAERNCRMGLLDGRRLATGEGSEIRVFNKDGKMIAKNGHILPQGLQAQALSTQDAGGESFSADSTVNDSWEIPEDGAGIVVCSQYFENLADGYHTMTFFADVTAEDGEVLDASAYTLCFTVSTEVDPETGESVKCVTRPVPLGVMSKTNAATGKVDVAQVELGGGAATQAADGFSAQAFDASAASEAVAYAGGKPVELPAVTVTTSSGRTLAEGTDYTLKYYRVPEGAETDDETQFAEVAANAIREIGSYRVVATPTKASGFSGEAWEQFRVARPISDCTVALVSGAVTYTGDTVKPDVVVTTSMGVELAQSGSFAASGEGDEALYEQSGELGDYTVSYANNVNAGTASVTVTGAGEWMGTVTKQFTIEPLALASVDVLPVGAQTYDGKAHEPALDVYATTAGGNALLLEAGDDYTVAYAGNVNAGTATATVTCSGNYKGATAVQAEFAIQKAKSFVRVADRKATYTGKAVASSKADVTGSKGEVVYAYYRDAKCTKAVAAADVKAAGIYYVKATVAADANYGAATSGPAKITIAKAANKLSAKVKATKKKPLSAKAAEATSFKLAKYAKVTNPAKGKLSYKKASGGKKVKVNAKTGNLTVAKGLASKTYMIKVRITSAATTNYKVGSKTVVLYIKVK